MSTPSTITATIPPPHHLHHYGYTQSQSSFGNTRRLPDPTSVTRTSGLVSSLSYPTNTPSSLPRHTSSSSMQPRPRAMPPSHSDSRLPTTQAIKREREPDWGEFYKNGIPKEIIQIDSDSDEEAPTRSTKVPAQQNKANVRGGGPNKAQPAAKKRKTEQASVYEPDRDQQPHYSQPNSGASHTASTDRTTSLQTTAPTSLGSHTSQGSSRTMTAAEVTTAAGQKRKRVVTRRSAADDLRRQQAEGAADALAHYCPPPKPPVRAPEVRVAPLRDVCTLPMFVFS